MGVAHLFFPIAVGLAASALTLLGWAAFGLVKAWRATARPRAKATALALAALAVGLAAEAFLIEPRSLVVREVEIVSPLWRGPPLRIAAIADTHVGGPNVDAARVGRVVARINALRPDLVLLLGDYVNGHAPEAARSPADNQEISGGVAVFAALNARYGVIAALGNHDVWYGRDAISAMLQNAGVATLWNRNVVIHRQGGDVVVAGLADAWTGEPDFAAALDGAPAGADTIVIAHNPDPFAAAAPGPALLLAGHTHCGQVTIPMIGRPILPVRDRAFACGLVRRGDQTVYVSGGIGTSGPPVRFLNPPEITLIVLRGAAPAPIEERAPA